MTDNTELDMIESAARAILIAAGRKWVEIDGEWAADVKRYHEMCAKFPDYEKGGNEIIDAFRSAKAVLKIVSERRTASPKPSAPAVDAPVGARVAGWVVSRNVGDGIFMSSDEYDEASAAAEADIHDRGYFPVYRSPPTQPVKGEEAGG